MISQKNVCIECFPCHAKKINFEAAQRKNKEMKCYRRNFLLLNFFKKNHEERTFL